MINKFYKTILNKYLRFFEFIFFLRYLITIFIISISIFLVIPYFFDYEKRVNTIKKYLNESYDFEIKHYEEIRFKALPTPRYEFKNVKTNFSQSSNSFTVKKLLVYPNILSIYDIKNFQTYKIILKDNSITIDPSFIKLFTHKLFTQKKKLTLSNLAIKIVEDDKSLIKVENVKFSNYGYNKNLITGKIFGKKFKIKIDDNFQKINFKLVNSGITADINYNYFDRSGLKKGIFKSKVLNTNLKFNFEHNDKELKILNLFLRSKNLSFSNNSAITLTPFMELNSSFVIEELNLQKFKKFDFFEIKKAKNLIKKINSKNKINFKSKKITKNLINEINLQIDFVYGIMNFQKQFLISDNLFQCDGSINLLEEFPSLFFNCTLNVTDKKKLYKIFGVKIKNNNESFKINTQGTLNILSKKINFENISTNDNSKSSTEDLNYYKSVFENIIFDESFLEIFNLKKIRKFIIKIS